MKINLFSFLLLLFTCFCTATNAQFTWKQDRASKEYTILNNNEVLIENVERFHGISLVDGEERKYCRTKVRHGPLESILIKRKPLTRKHLQRFFEVINLFKSVKSVCYHRSNILQILTAI